MQVQKQYLFRVTSDMNQQVMLLPEWLDQIPLCPYLLGLYDGLENIFTQ